MFVYRVEHKVYENGPYTSIYNKCRKLVDTHNNLIDSTKPAWMSEGFFSISDIDNYKACCKSLELLLDWFDWFTEYLHEMMNYHVVKYEIDDEYVKDGKSGLQSVFMVDLAIKVDSIPVDRIEEWF